MTYIKMLLFSIVAFALVGCNQHNQTIENKVNGVVLIQNILEKNSGIGTGFFIDKNTIVTNNHVIEGNGKIEVALESSSKFYDSKVIFSDPVADIAIVNIVDWDSFVKENKPIEYLTLSDKLPMRTEEVFAIGNPWGLTWSVSKGIVSYTLRKSPENKPMFYIQTDGDVFNGNSGGPLLDSDGNVIGINNLMIAREGGSYGLAITSEIVIKVLEDQKKYGHVKWPLIGVSIEKGTTVKEITPGSPAEKAGLKVNDVIKTIDNNRGVYEVSDIGAIIYRLVTAITDKPVVISFERDGKTQEVEILPSYRKTEELPVTQNK